MMATKPRPSDDLVEEETPQIVSTDDKQAEIERRLAMLGVEEPIAPEPAQVEEETEEPEIETPPPPPVDLLSTEEDTMSAPTMTEAEEPKVEVPVKPVQPVVDVPTVQAPAIKAPAPAAKSSKSALLARIMAAQERAKQAQLKQVSQETNESEHTSMQFEKEKMLRALNGISEDTKKKEEPPAIFQPPAPPLTSAKDNNNTPAPPPPSFEMFEMQMQQQPMTAVMPPPPAPVQFMAPPPPVMQSAPPAFDSLSMDIFEAPVSAPSAPTAPPVEAAAPDLLGGFGGIMPVPVAPPMEESHTETAALDEVYGCDMDGHALSPEEKARMIEEQRAIMEQIAKESSNEKTSMAAIKADAFAARMTGGGPATVDGFSASEVEEQRKILEQIEKQKSKSAQSSSAAAASGESVDIGGGKKVALHGTKKTQDSIDKGTAALVLCLNCNNWMQVAETATLMFCPICSVVSPVVKQDQIMSKEEILQMEEDRKLAERLQAEAYGDGEVSDYPANRRRATAGGAAAAAAAASAEEKSWWDTINDAMVSVGISSAEPELEEGKRSAEINTSSGHRMLHSVTTGEEGGDERVGLLGGGDDGYPAARVAQGKPLFSCVVDSISSTANMIAGGDEEEVHGVDTTSFLATPNVGRDRNESSGRYYAVPEHD